MLLYKSIEDNQSSPILQRDIAQMSCAQWCRLTQTDCNLLAICLPSKIRQHVFANESVWEWLKSVGVKPQLFGNRWPLTRKLKVLAWGWGSCMLNLYSDDKLQGGCCLIITLFFKLFFFSHLATIYYKISLRYFLENVRIMWTIFFCYVIVRIWLDTLKNVPVF